MSCGGFTGNRVPIRTTIAQVEFDSIRYDDELGTHVGVAQGMCQLE
jgi:hypothetical protein